MTAKIRVLNVIVQPVLVIDDGCELRPGPAVTSVTVRLSELATLADEINASVSSMQPSAVAEQI